MIFELKYKIINIADRSNFKIELVETEKDHVHILVDYKPNISIVQIVRRLKQETQYHMWTIFKKELSKVYWKDSHVFWSKGYFVCSVGDGASYETILKYIKQQG